MIELVSILGIVKHIRLFGMPFRSKTQKRRLYREEAVVFLRELPN